MSLRLLTTAVRFSRDAAVLCTRMPSETGVPRRATIGFGGAVSGGGVCGGPVLAGGRSGARTSAVVVVAAVAGADDEGDGAGAAAGVFAAAAAVFGVGAALPAVGAVAVGGAALADVGDVTAGVGAAEGSMGVVVTVTVPPPLRAGVVEAPPALVAGVAVGGVVGVLAVPPLEFAPAIVAEVPPEAVAVGAVGCAAGGEAGAGGWALASSTVEGTCVFARYWFHTTSVPPTCL